MKRLEQKEKRRQEILNTALDLFISKGYAATRTVDIAHAIGMSEGLLFHYFETKEKLYLALLEVAIKGKDNVFELKEASPICFFEQTAKMILNYITDNPFAAKLFVLMNRAQYEVEIKEQLGNFVLRKKDFEKSIAFIVQGQKEGSIREGNPTALATAFFMAIQGVVEFIAKNPDMPVPDSEWIVDIIRRK